MTSVERDILRKSEFNSTIRTIASTVSILCGMYFGGVEIKDSIVSALKNEIRQEYKAEILDSENRINKRIEDIENRVIAIERNK